MECPHVADLEELTLSSGLNSSKIVSDGIQCCVCKKGGCGGVRGQLWLCLKASCLRVVCSDHSLFHYQCEPSHSVQVNLGSLRLWCYRCDGEVIVASPQPTSKPKGVTGLQNVGNTCYMNAALQALSNTPPLLAHFLSSPAPPSPPLTAAFHTLLVDLWSPRRYPWVAPTSVLYGIRTSHPMFRGFQQQDTQEFLRCLMDQLHEEMKRPCIDHRPYHQPPDQDPASSEGEEYETCDSGVSERSSLSEEPAPPLAPPISRSPSPTEEVRRHKPSPDIPPHSSSPYKRKQHLSYRSIISDVFDGKLISSVQCLTCNRVSTRVETFQDLSLPIPSRDHIALLHHASINANCTHLYTSDQEGWWYWIWEWFCSWFWGPTVALHDCLAAFFSADDLKGDNMYSCEKCSKLRNGVKYSRVLECPEVLCIHLKRFRHEVMFSSKINSHVSFPLQGLDLTPYLHTNCPSEVTKYDLTSVICHHGTAGGGGHYTCFALNAESHKWFEFDDQNVRQVSADMVAGCEAYVLFYRKDWSVVNRVRRKAMRLEEMSRSEGDGRRWLLSQQWVERFNSWGEPGPIDNRGLLCPHGGFLPSDPHPVTVPQSIWSFLHLRFGGGPGLRWDLVQTCHQCSDSETSLLRVQWHEFKRLRKCNEEGSMAIQCDWLAAWEAHVLTSRPPPGPIDNSSFSPDSGEDYCEISSGQWELLVKLYSGGPPIHLSHQTLREYNKGGGEGCVDSGVWMCSQQQSQTPGVCPPEGVEPSRNPQPSGREPSRAEDGVPPNLEKNAKDPPPEPVPSEAEPTNST